MFTLKEKTQIKNGYFIVVRITHDYYELQSSNTKHCWIIKKSCNRCKDRSIIIYHKHTLGNSYYHRHGNAYTVQHAIKIIKSHDNYVLSLKSV